MMKKTLPVLTLALAIPGLAHGDPEVMWVQSGFDQPESVVSDAEGAHLYVSSIHGQPGEKNAQGYISKLSNDGKVVEKHWVNGLNAPKGMGIQGGQLFVTDIDRFLIIDLVSGEVLEQFSPPQAQFLNDVSVSDDGDVYVSDMMGNAIYRYDGQDLTLWLEDERLMHPNGVLADEDSLLVAGWGTPIAADFSTEEAGSLLRIGFQDKALTQVAGGEQLGNLDGVARIGDELLANDWMNGRLFRITADGQGTVAAELAPGVADIGAAGDVLYLPYMFDGEVRAVQLP
ncbi:SMP-30/gluconolactonase/LRE family protein [Marinobacter sp. HN1S83]|uniref:SMP-30/gluconolactonase/LRE family protein n=1 Tax=Marinobacter sp. HN1S83 TaxID=3382301 RepID=UPI00387B7B13